jgi:hypothetical protein
LTNTALNIAAITQNHQPALLGGVHLPDDEAKRLKSLAKKSVGIDKRAEEYNRKITALSVGSDIFLRNRG